LNSSEIIFRRRSPMPSRERFHVSDNGSTMTYCRDFSAVLFRECFVRFGVRYCRILLRETQRIARPIRRRNPEPLELACPRPARAATENVGRD
jgi:hypothetical protein